jgi:hypothetical protein
MISCAIWIKRARVSFFKDQNSTSPKDECYLRSLKNSRVHVYPNFTRNHAISTGNKVVSSTIWIKHARRASK